MSTINTPLPIDVSPFVIISITNNHSNENNKQTNAEYNKDERT